MSAYPSLDQSSTARKKVLNDCWNIEPYFEQPHALQDAVDCVQAYPDDRYNVFSCKVLPKNLKVSNEI